MAIQVIAAVYGTTSEGNDVTERVQNRLDQGNDDVVVSNEKMGGDPQPFGLKRFGILYRVNGGRKRARAGVEGDRIELVEPS
jgi:hypothetical protein